MQAFPKRKLVIGSTVLAVAAFAGGAVAATQGSSNPRQQYLNDVAKRLNVTPAQLNSALQRRGPRSAQRGRQGREAHAGSGQRAQAAHPAGSPRRRSVHRTARPGGPGGPGRGLATGRSDSASAARCSSDPTRRPSAVAKYLGLTEAQLLKQLQSGKSLADIAKAQGKTTSGLEQAITAAAKTRLDKAVANKRLTAAQEQKILSGLSARMNDLVNNTQFKGARPGFGFARPAFGLRPFAETTAAAKYLGLTKAQLRTAARGAARRSRRSPRPKARSTSGLEQAITASVKARLDKAVANKRITSAQEQKLLKALSTGIDAMVNSTRAEGSALRRTRTRVSEGFQGPLPAARELYPCSARARSARAGSACARRPVRLSSRRLQRYKLTRLSSSSHGFLIDGCCTGEASI